MEEDLEEPIYDIDLMLQAYVSTNGDHQHTSYIISKAIVEKELSDDQIAYIIENGIFLEETYVSQKLNHQLINKAIKDSWDKNNGNLLINLIRNQQMNEENISYIFSLLDIKGRMTAELIYNHLKARQHKSLTKKHMSIINRLILERELLEEPSIISIQTKGK